jgi:hypothetical protein
MTSVRDLIVRYLDEARTMQIATSTLMPEREKSSELGRDSDSVLPTSDEKNGPPIKNENFYGVRVP